MEAVDVAKRQKVEHSAANALAATLPDPDHRGSLAQELMQAVQDSQAAAEGLAVGDEQQGQAAAAVLRRVLHALERSPGASPLCSARTQA